jgi:hypothetical protein
MVTRERQAKVEYRAAVPNIVLQFDASIVGLQHLAGLVKERYAGLVNVTGLGEPTQQIVFPHGLEPVVISRQHYEQAKVGLGWERLAEFIVKQGFVTSYTDNELIISLEMPEDGKASYTPYPQRHGASSVNPPPWVARPSMRNRRRSLD